ncbi:peptidoglycan DD-metalloendopeptidase family protein [Eubacteriales bacterium OttesenSCG-928-M02]|nr:peptidoglycan DD-metalloendopeptidase family protein [Eubacteriales bacterium OttesenSCG-928-M02]
MATKRSDRTERPVIDSVSIPSRRAARDAGAKKDRKVPKVQVKERKKTTDVISSVPFIGDKQKKNELVLSDGPKASGRVFTTKVAPVLIALLIVLSGVYGASTLLFGKDLGSYLGGLTIAADEDASTAYALAMEKVEKDEANDLMAVSGGGSESYAILVGDVEVATCASEADATWVLDTIKNTYPGKENGNVSFGFKEEVKAEPSGQEPVSKEEALIKLENGAEGDAAFVNVVTTEVIYSDKTVAYTTNRKNDSSLYKGDTKVQTKGQNGTTRTTTTITYVNGVESGRESKDSVIKAPVTEVILVGTKAAPSGGNNKGGGGVSGAPSFIWPINATITSPFGQRWGRLHAGLDFGAKAGTPIKAAAGGTVTQASAGWNGGYGTVVVIQHNSTYSTRYAHMSKLGTSVGKKVSAGEVIGYVGNTGNSQGNHLHFEIRVNGVAKNPIPYLP